MGGATTTAQVTGKLGKALQFDGSDDYINLGKGSSLAGTGSHSLCGWYKNSGALRTIASKSSDFDGGGWGLIINGGNTTASAAVVVTNGPTQVNSPTITVAPNQWHHVCGVFTSGVSIKVYVDGFDSGTTATSDTALRTGGSSLIGWTGAGVDSKFSGTIDDVRIYNRALTAAEVNQLYNSR